MKVGDTFISPTGPDARFPEREMIVVQTMELSGQQWIDAEPIRPLASDRFIHSTYQLDEDGQVIPV